MTGVAGYPLNAIRVLLSVAVVINGGQGVKLAAAHLAAACPGYGAAVPQPGCS